jgi:hypothetical protein
MADQLINIHNHQETKNLAEMAYNQELTVSDVNNADINSLLNDTFDHSVLFWASYQCSVEVVDAILKRGVDVNSRSKVGKNSSRYIDYCAVKH